VGSMLDLFDIIEEKYYSAGSSRWGTRLLVLQKHKKEVAAVSLRPNLRHTGYAPLAQKSLRLGFPARTPTSSARRSMHVLGEISVAASVQPEEQRRVPPTGGEVGTDAAHRQP